MLLNSLENLYGRFFGRGLFKTLDFSVGVANVSARHRGPVKGETYFIPLGEGGGAPPCNRLRLVAQGNNVVSLVVRVRLDGAAHPRPSAEGRKGPR
jgi:hypothetical protein